MLLSLEQGTEAWREYRRKCVTATDFCIVAANAKLCKNIFHKSVKRLIKEKKEAKEQKDNKYFQIGRQYEPIILDSLNFISLVRGEVCNLWGVGLVDESDIVDQEYIMASLDARDDILNCVIEVKTTSKADEKMDELIEYYKYQVAHQCYVSDCDFGYLAIGRLVDDRVTHIEQIKVIPAEVISFSDWLRMCLDFLNKLNGGE